MTFRGFQAPSSNFFCQNKILVRQKVFELIILAGADLI